MAKYTPGDVVPFHLQPSIVFASFCTSLIGSITAIEMLHHRHPRPGLINHLQLGGCATIMGVVAIWCMHYIGNRAIVLGDGAVELQLVYNSAWTAFSCLMSVLAVFLALTAADEAQRKQKYVPLTLASTGVLMGLAVVGMHYFASFGSPQYVIRFQASYVVGASLLAICALVGALLLFFMLQDLWLSNFPSRLICAALISGTVTGVHFEASMGTSYVLKRQEGSRSGNRNLNVIVAAVLSLCTIPICIAIFVLAGRKQKKLARRAQEVVLTFAAFDLEGRLMVTHEGHLPSKKITSQSNQDVLDDDFTVSHPAFQWIFKVSQNWHTVSRFIPQMRRHLKYIAQAGKKILAMEGSCESIGGLFASDAPYSMILREGFCVAASDLAHELDWPLNEVGTLYQKVMMTGSLKSARHGDARSLRRIIGLFSFSASTANEAIRAIETVGRGQMLVLFRQMDQTARLRMFNRGYRFGSIEKVCEQLARDMQVEHSYMLSHLLNLRVNALQRPVPAPSGTRLAVFVLRAGISRKNWQVLVCKDIPSRLPCVQLSGTEFDPDALSLLHEFDGLSINECIHRLVEKCRHPDEPHLTVYTLFKQRILMLAKLVAEPFVRQAIFLANPLTICQYNAQTGKAHKSKMFAFYVVPDIHRSELRFNSELEYIPLSYFRSMQQVAAGIAYWPTLQRQVHQEFSSDFSQQGADKDIERYVSLATSDVRTTLLDGSSERTFLSKILSMKWLYNRNANVYRWNHSRDGDQMASDSATSILNPASLAGHSASKVRYGGILVTSEITIEEEPTVDDGNQEGRSLTMETGTTSRADVAGTEYPTFADDLFNVTVSRLRDKPFSPFISIH